MVALCSASRRTLRHGIGEVFQRDHDEQPIRGRNELPGAFLSHLGPDVEFAAGPGHEVRTDLVGRPQQHRREELGVELAGDGHIADDIEQHAHHVVENGDDGAAMCDPGCAAMSAVEDMPGNHPVATPPGSQAMAMRIVCPASKTPRVVLLQVVTIVGNTTMPDGVQPRGGRICIPLLVDDETLLIVNAQRNFINAQRNVHHAIRNCTGRADHRFLDDIRKVLGIRSGISVRSRSHLPGESVALGRGFEDE